MGLDLYLYRRHKHHMEELIYWRKQWWVVEYFRKFGKWLDDESGFDLTEKELSAFVLDCKRVLKYPAKRRSILGIDPHELDREETLNMLQEIVEKLDGIDPGDYTLYASY